MGRTRFRTDLDPVADLIGRISRGQRRAVQTWWADHELAAHPATVGKRIAFALLAQPSTATKRAGIVILGELLGDQLRAHDLPVIAHLFVDGHLADPKIASAVATGVLGALLAREAGRGAIVRALLEWRYGEAAQRRAACVAFERIAQEPGHEAACLELCATIVWSHLAEDQAGVAAVLSQLATREPVRVAAFLQRYARFMSRSCITRACAALPVASRTALLANWKRATTIRR